MYEWGDDVDSNAIEVHIHNLRKKIGMSLKYALSVALATFSKKTNDFINKDIPVSQPVAECNALNHTRYHREYIEHKEFQTQLDAQLTYRAYHRSISRRRVDWRGNQRNTRKH